MVASINCQESYLLNSKALAVRPEIAMNASVKQATCCFNNLLKIITVSSRCLNSQKGPRTAKIKSTVYVLLAYLPYDILHHGPCKRSWIGRRGQSKLSRCGRRSERRCRSAESRRGTGPFLWKLYQVEGEISKSNINCSGYWRKLTPSLRGIGSFWACSLFQLQK